VSAIPARSILTPVRAVPVFAPNPLRTARLLIRPLRESDREAFMSAVAPMRAELAATMSLLRLEEPLDAFFERQISLLRRTDDQSAGWRRIAFDDAGAVVGGFNLFGITRGLTFEAEANWWITPDKRGQGLATEGVRAMLDAAFADLPVGLGLHAVHASIDPANTPSIRLAQRIGMRCEGGSRRVSILLGDRWVMHETWTIRS